MIIMHVNIKVVMFYGDYFKLSDYFKWDTEYKYPFVLVISSKNIWNLKKSLFANFLLSNWAILKRIKNK